MKTIYSHSIHSWKEADQYLGVKTERPLGNNTRLERRDDNVISVKYHGSAVVRYFPDELQAGAVILDSCEWKTFTTKERINAFCPKGFHVYQERGVWYLSKDYDWNNPLVFADGIAITPNGVVNAGPSNEADRVKKLTKSILKYAKGYSAAMIAGEIPAPSGGDCWYCCMQDDKGDSLGKISGNTDHLISHLEDSYFVPSLAVRAVESYHMCAFSKGAIGEIWQGHKVSDFETGILVRDLTACIVHYFKKNLNLAA